MDYYSMSDAGILRELGSRIRDQRLNCNISQTSLAAKAGVSLKVIQNIEYGKTATITGFLRVMRALHVLGQLDLFLPMAGIRPSVLYKLQGKSRQRASKVLAIEKA